MSKKYNIPIYGKRIAYEEEQRHQALLRRKGRGRKTGYVLSPYLENYERIFGETDIFKNLLKPD